MNLTIGQLANKADINVETIRYYERRGLINRPVKPKIGYRKYDNEILQRLHFIRKAKALGFKLEEIKNLLLLSEGHCDDVQSIAQHKLDQVRDKLNDLNRLEEVLDVLIRRCSKSKDKAHCPIIESLLNDNFL